MRLDHLLSKGKSLKVRHFCCKVKLFGIKKPILLKGLFVFNRGFFRLIILGCETERDELFLQSSYCVIRVKYKTITEVAIYFLARHIYYERRNYKSWQFYRGQRTFNSRRAGSSTFVLIGPVIESRLFLWRSGSR
jgi:hypothetical protein